MLKSEKTNFITLLKNKAIYIPQLMRNRQNILILIIFLLASPPLITISKAESEVFYIRSDIKYSDSHIEKSNFLMVPAENDFRTEKFTSVFIKGTADFSHNIPGISIETQAKHNALKHILERRGLKSIKSKSTTVNDRQHNEIIISYEGAVKLPLKVIKKKTDKQNKLCTMELKIEFAPIAFPDKWSVLQLRYKIKRLFNNFILLFK